MNVKVVFDESGKDIYEVIGDYIEIFLIEYESD